MPQEPTPITEQDLLQLGFEKETADDGSYYFFRRFSAPFNHSPINSPIDLITDETSNEKEEGEGWTVSMYDHDWIKFKYTKDLYKIIALLESFT